MSSFEAWSDAFSFSRHSNTYLFYFEPVFKILVPSFPLAFGTHGGSPRASLGTSLLGVMPGYPPLVRVTLGISWVRSPSWWERLALLLLNILGPSKGDVILTGVRSSNTVVVALVMSSFLTDRSSYRSYSSSTWWAWIPTSWTFL